MEERSRVAIGAPPVPGLPSSRRVEALFNNCNAEANLWVDRYKGEDDAVS